MSRKCFYVQGAGAQGGPHSWSRTLVINLLTARGGGDVRTMAILHQQRSPSSRFPKYQNTRYGDDFVETGRVVRAEGSICYELLRHM